MLQAFSIKRPQSSPSSYHLPLTSTPLSAGKFGGNICLLKSLSPASIHWHYHFLVLESKFRELQIPETVLPKEDKCPFLNQCLVTENWKGLKRKKELNLCVLV